MQVPVRVLLALRPSLALPALVAIAASTTVFVGTPFLIPAVADQFDVGDGTAGLISAFQLLGFMLGSYGGGRLLRPTRTVFVVTTAIGVAGSVAAGLAATFPILLGARFVIGASLGLAAWFAWQAAFGDDAKTNDIAVVGPIVGVVLTPIVATFVETTGADGFFFASAVVLALPLLFVTRVTPHAAVPPRRARHRPTRAAAAILVALCLLTLGGSSVFIYAAAIGRDIDGMSAGTITIAFTANALAGIPAARWRGSRGPAWLWFAATGAAAVVTAAVHHQVALFVALTAWGFCYFMGLPSAFALLATRSRYPEERAGDAQAVMAAGRVIGPLFGGALYATGSTVALGIGAAAVMGVGAVLLAYVDRRRFAVARPRPERLTPIRSDPAAG